MSHVICVYTASRQAERLSSVEYDNICPLKRTVAHYASGGLFLTDVARFVHNNEASHRHHCCFLPVSVVFVDIRHSVWCSDIRWCAFSPRPLFQRLSAQSLMAANLSHQADHYLACFFFCAHMWGTTPSSNLWCKGSLLVNHPIPLQQAEDTGRL